MTLYCKCMNLGGTCPNPHYDPQPTVLTAPVPPSPADLRCNLNPEHVAALAQQLHKFRCLLITGQDPHRDDPDHPETDLAAARFLLMGLRDDNGLTLTTT